MIGSLGINGVEKFCQVECCHDRYSHGVCRDAVRSSLAILHRMSNVIFLHR